MRVLVHDGMRALQAQTTSNGPQVTSTRGTDLSGSTEGAGGIGGLLGRSHGYSAGNWSTHNFYHADGSGNVTYLVNSSQTMAARYQYDAYGNLLSFWENFYSLGTANTYRFSSKMLDLTSGLYYYGYRWYAPNVQRWPNSDPLGESGGMNLYRFAANSSVDVFDPFGLSCATAAANCVAAIAAATATCASGLRGGGGNLSACRIASVAAASACTDSAEQCWEPCKNAMNSLADWMDQNARPSRPFVWTPPSRRNAPPVVVIGPPLPPQPLPPIFSPPPILKSRSLIAPTSLDLS